MKTAKVRYPWASVTRNKVEVGAYVWPVKGVMLGIVVGRGQYRSSRTPHVASLALGPVVLLFCDVRPKTVARGGY